MVKLSEESVNSTKLQLAIIIVILIKHHAVLGENRQKYELEIIHILILSYTF